MDKDPSSRLYRGDLNCNLREHLVDHRWTMNLLPGQQTTSKAAVVPLVDQLWHAETLRPFRRLSEIHGM